MLQKLLAWPICLIFLIGVIAAGNSNVICIANNGHVKFEALCVPCCGESEFSCESGLPEKHNDEFVDCSHCSDIELEIPFMLNRNQEIESDRLSQLNLALKAFTDAEPISAGIGDTPILSRNPIFGVNPPTFYITTTILRC